MIKQVKLVINISFQVKMRQVKSYELLKKRKTTIMMNINEKKGEEMEKTKY